MFKQALRAFSLSQRTVVARPAQAFRPLPLPTRQSVQARPFSLSVARFNEDSALNHFEDESASSQDEGKEIYIGNLPWTVSEADLREYVSEFGQATHIRLHQNAQGQPTGSAHIELSSADEARRLVEVGQEQSLALGGRTLRVDWPRKTSSRRSDSYKPTNATPSNSIFLGSVPWDVTESEIIDLGSQYGPVRGARVGVLRDGRPAGYAHLDFESAEGATRLYEAGREKKVEMLGRVLNVDYSASRNAPTSTVYVTKLPPDASSSELTELANEFKPTQVKMTGGGDFAHIEFMSVEQADAFISAVKEQRLTVGGQPIQAEYARGQQKERFDRKPRGQNRGFKNRRPSYGSRQSEYGFGSG